MSRRGRPALRPAAWRATWAVLRHCDVLAAKHAALTSRDQDRLADAQARVACAASLLRWIYALIVHGTSWDAKIAADELGHDHAITSEHRRLGQAHRAGKGLEMNNTLNRASWLG